MTFAHWIALLFGIGAVQYLGLAVAYYFGLRPGMSIALVGYAVANVGLVYDIFHSAPK